MALAALCLFLSGATSLVCEICWIRRASLVFGASAPAVGTVLAVFFAGLALGSEHFGRRAGRTRRPLRLCGRAQLARAAAVIGSLAGLALIERLVPRLLPADPGSPLAQMAVRALLVGAILLAPTFLMGAALPLFCEALLGEPQRRARGSGALYAGNTLGAAAGAAAGGLWLLPRLGVTGSTALAALIDAGVGLLLMSGPGRVAAPAGPPGSPEMAGAPARPAPEPDRAAAPTRALVGALFLVCGFTGMASEVIWIRFLGLLFANSVLTYAFTLTVILGGIAAGSLVASWLGDRGAQPALAFGGAMAGHALLSLALLFLPAALWRERLAVSNAPAVQLRALLLLMLPPATLGGLAFPLAVRLAVGAAGQAGRGVGRLAALNTLGGIAGSLATTFLFLPRLGLGSAARLTAAAGVVAAAAAWWSLPGRPGPLLRIALSAGAAALWTLLPRLSGTRLPEAYLAAHGQLLEHREGLTGLVAVVRRADVTVLEIDNWWQGEDRRSHQVMAAHIPMLLHPAPRRVLGIGLGTGQTFRRFLLYPIERLDCVELEPAVASTAARWFDLSWMGDPRARLWIGDGRHFLAHPGPMYDIISIEVGQSFRPGVAPFYTLDFYRQARRRLAPGGLIAQFLPLLFIPPQELRGLIATFLAAFPQAALWYNTSELLLLGSVQGEVRPDPQRIERRLADETLRRDLEFAYWNGPSHWVSQMEVLVAGFLLGPAELARLAAEAAVYRDDPPRLDYALARSVGGQDPEPAVALLEAHLAPLEDLLPAGAPPEERERADSARQHNLRDIVALYLDRRASQELAAGRAAPALDLLEAARRANPLNVVIANNLGAALLAAGKPAAAAEAYRDALAIDASQYRLHNQLAIALAGMGDRDGAVRHYRAAIELAADAAEPRQNLGTLLLTGGDAAGAAELLRAALALDPANAKTHNNLGIALVQMGQTEEAVDHFRAALRLRPDYLEARENLAAMLADPAPQPE